VSDQSSKKGFDYLQSGNSDLSSLLKKVKILDELNKRVATYLDKAIADYCQVANLLGNKLVIIAANGSIATQLRFQVTDLLRKFKQDPHLSHIQQIDAKVHPNFLRQQSRQSLSRQNKSMEPLSTDTAETINKLADTLDDQKLKEVMKRIASHTRKEK